TDRGVGGWGEAYGGGWQATVAALDHWVLPLALGQDATDADLTLRLERALHNLGRAGPVIHAISGLDIALWGLRGKVEGGAVHSLLGGSRRRRVEAYASLLSYGGSVEHVRRNVARALERGYRRIKLHERTAETVAATREVAGRDVPIMVDTNCAWLPDAATAAVMAMASSQPLWVEEPIWPPEDFSSLAALRRATGVPTAAGENATGALDFRKMIVAGAVDYVQPSAVKIGGLSVLWRICGEAGVDGVTCVPHAPYFGPPVFCDAARARGQAARERPRALLLRAGADALRGARAGRRRGCRGARRPGFGRRPGAGADRALPRLMRRRQISKLMMACNCYARICALICARSASIEMRPLVVSTCQNAQPLQAS